MSWIDQGRQEHGWFGHGTAPRPPSGELGARAFAIVDLAADQFPNQDDLPFPLEKTTEVLRTLAPLMAPHAGLAPNAFRQRFFDESFDPVDAWTIQQVMRDVAASDTHTELVQSGRLLAATIRERGKAGWTRLLGTAIAKFAPSEDASKPQSPANVQQVQYAVPAGPLPLLLPPSAIPGTRENKELTDATIKGLRAVGNAIGHVFESRRYKEEDDDEETRRKRPPRPAQPAPTEAADQDGETQKNPPPGSKPINETPWSGDHGEIKGDLQAKGKDDVRISPEGDVWVKNPNGTWSNHGPAESYTESGKPTGRRGKDREQRPGS